MASKVMHWLDRGLPITLLCDLAAADGPDSRAINAAERPADDPVWAEAAVDAPARRDVSA